MEEDGKPARRSVEMSGLSDGLDSEADGDLVADHRASGLRGNVDAVSKSLRLSTIDAS
jgi:hypothetical protein